jgi:VanZ family protein
VSFLALIAALAAWIIVTSKLAVEPRTGLNSIENLVRGFLIRHEVLGPEWKHYQPPYWDNLQHLLFYGPFGLFAGLAGSIASVLLGNAWRSRFMVLGLAVGLSVALLDELSQNGLPDRRPGWDDLIAGWAGILLAFTFYLGCLSLARRWSKKPTTGMATLAL